MARDVAAMNAYCDSQFPPWSELLEETVVPPQAELRALPWGHYQLDLATLPHGVPDEPQLQIDWQCLQLPAVLAFPSAPSLLVETEDEGRRAGHHDDPNVYAAPADGVSARQGSFHDLRPHRTG